MNHLKIYQFNLSAKQLDAFLQIDAYVQEKAKKPDQPDALDRSDREYEIENWLEKQGVENAWELAHLIVNLGYSIQKLEEIQESVTPLIFNVAIDWTVCLFQIYALLEEISMGAGRIVEIVKALKSYTYLDQAPNQAVNIHEGLDNTLVILRSKLKHGVTVHREYAQDIPAIQAYGSELNQVWTNLIDNAIDAMDGQGELTLRTSFDEQWVYVEIEDQGSGIPENVLPHIFDPFFTTKPVGVGTGLGLPVARKIIDLHRGEIDIRNNPDGGVVATVILKA
jgi:signal transduction histidine kinase